MRTLYILLATLALGSASGCSTRGSLSGQMTTVDPSISRFLSAGDPRCTPGQWCAYTDAPAPIRTQVLR
jgi:hypothetical protein